MELPRKNNKNSQYSSRIWNRESASEDNIWSLNCDKENMSDRMDSGADDSLVLQLDDTMMLDKSQETNLTSGQPSLQDPYGECSQKPFGDVQQSSLDDSVMIYDSPNVTRKSISLIDLSDSSHDTSLKLELSDTQTQSITRSPLASHTSPMSEILAPNSLLYQDCDNIDKVIDDDEDVQSMMDQEHLREDGDILFLDKSPSVTDLSILSPKKSLKEGWSPKKEIWSSKNEKKRKAKEASLSSGDESNTKRIDVKQITTDLSLHTTYTKLQDHHQSPSFDIESGSRPLSSQDNLDKMSTSPLIDDMSTSPQVDPETEDSVPGVRKLSISDSESQISTPQKQLRKKLQTKRATVNGKHSEEEVHIQQGAEGEESQQFKAPSPINPTSTLTLNFSDPRAMGKFKENMHLLEYRQVKELLEKLSGGPKDIVLESVQMGKKRLSDVSSFSKSSSGGSSGYMAGSSSGSSSHGGGRSRLSIAPDTIIEPHRVISKLPLRQQKNEEKTEESEDKPNVEFVDDEGAGVINSQKIIKNVADEKSLDSPQPSRKGRKKKESWNSEVKKSTPSRKKIKRNATIEEEKVASDAENEDKAEGTAVNHRYAVGSKVFSRWVDGTGVYFYAAIILEVVNEEEIKVKFIDDRIERVVKKDNEVITISQLHPGDQVTVKHSIYKAYEVSASLMSYPKKTHDGDVLYEISITPTDSEPSPNEDSRAVTHKEISLTDNQASAVIRKLGLIPASNKVSASINFENLIFSKRKARSTADTPTKADTPNKDKVHKRKRGGEYVEDSAPTVGDSSTHEHSPAKAEKNIKQSYKDSVNKSVGTPKRVPRTPKAGTGTPQRRQIGRATTRISSTDDEDEVMPKISRRMQASAAKTKDVKTPSRGQRSTKKNDLFQKMSFVLTQAKKLPAGHQSDNVDSYAESESEQATKSSSEPKYDRRNLQTLITGQGGMVLSEFPGEGLDDPDMELVAVCDTRCVTMTYLLALSQQVPVVSHLYILNSVTEGALLDRTAYLLPAGFSTLLMREVEQGQDCGPELRINDCLLPSPPATSTRGSSSRPKEEDYGRKILSGLHILVISLEKEFTDDWQNVLDSLGAAVTKRSSSSTRLSQLRAPDVVVTDSKAPGPICQDLGSRSEIPVVSTNWVIQCVVNNARIAYNNFRTKLPDKI